MKNTKVIIPTIPDLYELTSEDKAIACEMLGKAFSNDPIWKEIMKDHVGKMQYVFEMPINYSLKYGKIYADSKEIKALAAWVPTPYTNMTLWRTLRSKAIKSLMDLGLDIIKKISTVFNIIERDRRRYIQGPFIYLYVLGVHPDYQGQGLGTKLMTKMIENLPPNVSLYLETESEQNVSFYKKFGFFVKKKVQVPMLNLPLWEMIRPPS